MSVDRALELAERFGGIDGGHHKQWVIDQMVRALTHCPLETHSAVDSRGKAYTYEAQGESAEYRAWVASACAGADGPDTYSWEVGTPP